MYLKLRCLIHLFLAILLGLACAAAQAQAASVSSTRQTGRSSLRGHITDPSGALIPGAQITVTTANGAVVAHLTADATGGYVLRGLAAGTYVIEAEAQGFTRSVSAPIQLAIGQAMIEDVKMIIATAQQQVQVTAEGEPTLSTQADQNASAVVLQGKQLQGLSDDPDELQNELQALAGPSAGPNGGQIYINGFTGGELPPKSAIREIRINQNPFSAEFDRLGYGRIEILTKPGTGQMHGRFFAQGNDDSFNTGNPFTTNLPSYYSFQYDGTVSGPISKNISFFVSADQRRNQSDSVYSLAEAPVFDAASNSYSALPVSGSIFNPNTITRVSPRFDFELGQKNTLTLRYQFFRYDQSGSIGSTSLPSQSASSNSTNNAVQFDDTQIINDRLVNETRGEFERRISTSTPVSSAPTIDVPGSFSGGGNGSQYSNSHDDHWELQNITTWAAGAHAIKFGVWLRDNREAIFTNGNFNGSFTFPSVAAFVDTANGVAQGETFAQIAAACPSTQTGGCLPTNLSYTSGSEKFRGNVFDGALYFQDDWKVKTNLTLSGGLRWETQNHTADHSDWGPRVALAYSPRLGHKSNGPDKTVIRAGFGFFYDRFDVDELMDLEQYNGGLNSQQQVTIANPTCFDPNSLSNIDLASCGTATTATPEIYQISPSYRAPYSEQLGGSVERQLTRFATMTVTYLHSFGAHQLVVRDANAFLPGTFEYGSSTLTGVRPDPTLGIVRQYFPEAIYKQNQVIVNVNAQFSANLGVTGFYNWTDAHSDGGGGSNPSNSYNLSQDYGRPGWIHPQMLFLMGNYSAPWALIFNPFMVIQAGRPFNYSTPYDLTGDAFFNDRPAYATAASNPSNVVDTSLGNFDTVPQPGEAILGPNLGNSPSGIAFNLRLSRAFGIGPKVGGEAGGPPPGGGPPGGGFRGGGPGRGGFGGGFGGPFGMRGGGGPGGNENTGRKYSLTFSAQALNLFNNIDLGTPVGNVTAKSFNQSTGLAGGIFSTAAASRRVFFQSVFQF